MRRAVVTVATGRYRDGGRRLGKLLAEHGNCNYLLWTDPLPTDWPSHKEKPYAFKAWSLCEAARDYDLLIWADAAMIPIRSLEPLWERIEQDGYWMAVNGWTNYEWTADSAYVDLFPGVPIEEAREINKTFPQVVATSFGLNVRSEIGKEFLDEYYRLSNTNAFCGPWSNANNPSAPYYGPGGDYTTAPCGPADVLGHRHDQTAASMLAWKLKMKLTQCPEVFSYPPGNERTLLLAVGA